MEGWRKWIPTPLDETEYCVLSQLASTFTVKAYLKGAGHKAQQRHDYTSLTSLKPDDDDGAVIPRGP